MLVRRLGSLSMESSEWGLFNRCGWGFSEKCNGKKMWVQIRQRTRGLVGWVLKILFSTTV